jgi:hypothetical protein
MAYLSDVANTHEKPAEHVRNALQLLFDLRRTLADSAPDVAYVRALLRLIEAIAERLNTALWLLEHPTEEGR